MSKFNILYVGSVPEAIREELRSRLPEGFALEFLDEGPPEERAGLLSEAHFIMGFPGSITPRALRMAGNLRMVQLLSAGYDELDMELANELGLPVANNGGANSIAVAEHTILLILSLYKRLCRHHDSLRRGVWLRERDHPLDMFELAGKAVGIVGFGNVGRALAERLRGFQVKMRYHDIVRSEEHEDRLGVEYLGLDEVLRTSDIVSVHVPLTASTRNMIGAKELNRMKRTAVLINTSRGEVVDEGALYRALKEHKIAGAGLDVFAREGDIQKGTCTSPLFELENVVVTPHYAGHTFDTWLRRIRIGYENIVNCTKGEPRYIVNREALSRNRGSANQP
ncbi:hypothetical protein AC482_00800 [miscellaneous Crenarchaeota group-15 archaeon DG-45]|uniref:Lactate dehydrogenase n=1 Tax=miscellaneous Crenarchaeota group-15 archaeon DG-45 TaxID=1685127 RepID=A0A0M0BTJ7_9ARCH|nr:MAG: hypothetical protein AC482_00800 [miscellaneous Crenarchaeota group-15 archaeon DG-45]